MCQRPTRIAALTGVMLLLSFASGIEAQTYMLRMPVIEVAPAESFALPIEGDWIEPVTGFQLSIAFPIGAPIQSLGITVENSLVGALEPEFIQLIVDPMQGWIVGGVLFEVLLPFDGISLPPVGFPLLIAEITGDIPADTPDQIITFDFLNGLGTPPVNNTFVVGFASVPPQELTNGGLDIINPPATVIEDFVRGDVNMDTHVDIGDAIYHLSYTFSGGPLPLCLDAGDANDDGHSDVSDAIYILYYFFVNGPAPWPPFPNAGPDPTLDSIGCESGL